ncbi:FG-GAP-like repeat-containing protein [Gilvibacter sediminis]|uniref:FG-GAP-like repeat-containing protein n=1 Tax=Gilvibacter sediminis TaxID=379071 RepID=UPI00234FB760|nr:FG-GAP-like repeat-containing protein [Gilvibacter sediminis]MDC7997796.1 FG-GAP-like repeat-containing protein [Gilvibacter sediminis]
MRSIPQLVIPFLLLASGGHGQVLFEETATSLGLNEIRNIGDGTGISFVDFDDDGWDDITVCTNAGEPVRFYKNTGGDFTEISFDIDDPMVASKSVVWVDFDNDGDKDLFVSCETGPNKFYRNDDFNFIDITESAGFPTTNVYTNSASWGDYNNDGLLDVFLANRDLSQVIPNMLYKNNDDGTFTLVNNEALIGNRSELSFQGTFYDINNDGYMELYLINDRLLSKNIMYKNQANGTFSDISFFSGSDYQMNAMSSAIEDYDYDGYTDMYITNTTIDSGDPDPGNYLMKNNGDETFSNTAISAGVQFGYFSWGAVWLDGDLDGYLDLYVSGQFATDGGGILPAAYYDNQGDASFERIVGQGFEEDLAFSYGNAMGDIDNDGYPDIIVANRDPYTDYIWKNKTSELNNNNYFKVKLEGTVSNRDGIGARIELLANGLTQYRFTASLEGYLSQNSEAEFFGLGTAATVDQVKVYWPSGIVDTYNDLSANQTVTIIEDNAILSVEEQQIGQGLRLYPNPATEVLNLQLPKESMESYVVYNTLGQEVLSGKFNTSHQAQIDLSNLSAGVFVLKVTATNRTITERFIKQ